MKGQGLTRGFEGESGCSASPTVSISPPRSRHSQLLGGGVGVWSLANGSALAMGRQAWVPCPHPRPGDGVALGPPTGASLLCGCGVSPSRLTSRSLCLSAGNGVTSLRTGISGWGGGSHLAHADILRPITRPGRRCRVSLHSEIAQFGISGESQGPDEQQKPRPFPSAPGGQWAFPVQRAAESVPQLWVSPSN